MRKPPPEAKAKEREAKAGPTLFDISGRSQAALR